MAQRASVIRIWASTIVAETTNSALQGCIVCSLARMDTVGTDKKTVLAWTIGNAIRDCSVVRTASAFPSTLQVRIAVLMSNAPGMNSAWMATVHLPEL